ncbi:MAG: hypothetical protein GX682_00335 [Clostridiaceae bacterium]|nr:hypothetical protein [Clostridiaceae bacterium]
MTRRKKIRIRNIILAITYLVVGIVGTMASGMGICSMWLSGKFLPVYISGIYVVGNQVLRYLLYAIMFAAIIVFVMCGNYGYSYLSKKRKKH